ncbi:SURF1 family protein [Bogoriella caseilytica]|uniref:SURF1-like protein n=1 Tax=Bogoriella caseilytica TaxID=56055 RepID=A0A3N2BED8_9MICO|nr:SURF1 family protein [Bogoriella caseilytica]ROR73618.1 cytochrome oxidase assembly protein ShyY1 [Bogoriella caseilytica]
MHPSAVGSHGVDGTRRDYLRAALTGRMIALLVFFLFAAVVCVMLASWQLDRAGARGAAEAESAHADLLAAEIVPLEDVLSPQTSFREEHLAVPVEVTGEFGGQVYAPGARIDGEDAVLVIAELRVTGGQHAGAMIPVLRGWVPPEDLGHADDPGLLAAELDEAAGAPPLAPPEGETTVTGWLKDSELGRTSPGPGLVSSVSTAELASLWGGPTWTGYVVEFASMAEPEARIGTSSPAGLAHASPPAPAQESGLNIRNLAYAIEWVIFGGFALALWVRMVRDSVRNRREDAALAAQEPVTEPAVSR